MIKKILCQHTRDIWNNYAESIAKWAAKGFVLLILAIYVACSEEILQIITAFVIQTLIGGWKYISWIFG